MEKVEDLLNASSATSTPINCKSMVSVQTSTQKKRPNDGSLKIIEPPIKRRKLSQDSDKSQKLDIDLGGAIPQSLNSSCTNSQAREIKLALGGKNDEFSFNGGNMCESGTEKKKGLTLKVSPSKKAAKKGSEIGSIIDLEKGEDIDIDS